MLLAPLINKMSLRPYSPVRGWLPMLVMIDALQTTYDRSQASRVGWREVEFVLHHSPHLAESAHT